MQFINALTDFKKKTKNEHRSYSSFISILFLYLDFMIFMLEMTTSYKQDLKNGGNINVIL